MLGGQLLVWRFAMKWIMSERSNVFEVCLRDELKK